MTQTSNESATSFKWLIKSLGLSGQPYGRCNELWKGVRKDMRTDTQVFHFSQEWQSDFWICKTSKMSAGYIGDKWCPPEEFDEWPTFLASDDLVDRLDRPHLINFLHEYGTNHPEFSRLLSSATDIIESSSDSAVSEFDALDRATTHRGDLAMIQAQYVRAWLATALGNLLMSIALSPQTAEEQLVAESRRRLLIPREYGWRAPTWAMKFAEGEIAVLYNCRQSPRGNFSFGGIRIGQGDEWLRHWQWISLSVDAEQVVPALALTAKLLRCRPLLTALLSALDAKDRDLEYIALAVLRRWLLSLKAMAWLEDALARSWNQVRTQDLACFAFNAVKPDWPRRFVALSHRSMDAKPALMTMNAWRSSLVAIDANYAPSWETNTGMIWGLFATAPLLCRIRSPNYEASEWCEREGEMFDYLQQTCDFMPGRAVIDIDIKGLSTLDKIIVAMRPETNDNRPLGRLVFDEKMWSEGRYPEIPLPEFPPLSQVYLVNPILGWPLTMLRAAAALRVLYATYRDAWVANWFYNFLCTNEGDPPDEAPTNNRDGWDSYRKIFRELQRECGCESGTLALSLSLNTPPWHPDKVEAFWNQIPDLSQDKPILADILAALEWRATLLPILEEADLGDMILIDLRGLTRETWESDPRLSMARGILTLRSPAQPIWLIQLAWQRVDEWGLPDDHPIFTQYAERQFAWMYEGSLSWEWPDAYAERCGLILSPELREKCRSTKRNK